MKIYQSRAWLWKKYKKEKMTEKQIAELAGTSQSTIHNWLKKHGII